MQSNNETVSDLTLLNNLSLQEWQQQNTEKDPGPPICDDVFCNTGGDINSGTLPENDIYFFHPDHLGSTSYITNIAGETVQFNTYMPFGESFVSQQRFGIVSQYTFLSKEKDLETGLHYLSARYYNSQLSVFLSIDPLWEQTGDPYGYSYRNPIKYLDPTGMSPQDDYKLHKDGTLELMKKTDDDFDKIYNEDESNSIEVDKEFLGGMTQNKDFNMKKNRLQATETKFEFDDPNMSNNDIFEGFKFLARNSDVEWSYDRLSKEKSFLGIEWTDNMIFINSQHKYNIVKSNNTIKLLNNGFSLDFSVHTHPGLGGDAAYALPSGFYSNGKIMTTSNPNVINDRTNIINHKKAGHKMPNYQILMTPNNKNEFIYYNDKKFSASKSGF